MTGINWTQISSRQDTLIFLDKSFGQCKLILYLFIMNYSSLNTSMPSFILKDACTSILSTWKGVLLSARGEWGLLQQLEFVIEAISQSLKTAVPDAHQPLV